MIEWTIGVPVGSLETIELRGDDCGNSPKNNAKGTNLEGLPLNLIESK